MERGKSLFIIKVKGQISRSLDLYKKFQHLDPCGQDLAVSMLKLSMYTSYGSGRSLFIFKFEGHISRLLDLYKNSGTWIHVGRI